MTESDIENALTAALQAVSGLPRIILPNEATDALAPPYIALEFIRTAPDPQYLNLKHELTGTMQAGLVTQKGSFTADAKTYAEIIVSALPMNRQITAGDGTIRIAARPAIIGGYVDGERWRTPVQIRYRGWTT